MAQCKVIYVGNPSEMDITVTGATVKHDDTWNVDIVEVKSGET